MLKQFIASLVWNTVLGALVMFGGFEARRELAAKPVVDENGTPYPRPPYRDSRRVINAEPPEPLIPKPETLPEIHAAPVATKEQGVVKLAPRTTVRQEPPAPIEPPMPRRAIPKPPAPAVQRTNAAPAVQRQVYPQPRRVGLLRRIFGRRRCR